MFPGESGVDQLVEIIKVIFMCSCALLKSLSNLMRSNVIVMVSFYKGQFFIACQLSHLLNLEMNTEFVVVNCYPYVDTQSSINDFLNEILIPIFCVGFGHSHKGGDKMYEPQLH